jgi:hypothetical protein
MNKQLIKRMLKELSAREDLTELVNNKVSDVKYKGFKKNSQNNYRLEFNVKGEYKGLKDKTHYIFRKDNKMDEFIKIHYCLLWLEKDSE